jgi:hypothetical protein
MITIDENGNARRVSARTFTKHYETTVTNADNWKIARQLSRMLRSANAKKLGRHRRGTVFLSEATSHWVAEGRYRWSLTFQTGSRFVRVLDVPTGGWLRFERHGLMDFRPLLRRLSR